MVGFGNQFRAWRKEVHLTQQGLADRLGVSFTYISKIEHDATGVPPSETFCKSAARILGVEEEAMIELSGRTMAIPIAKYKELLRAFTDLAERWHWQHGPGADGRDFEHCSVATCILNRAVLREQLGL